MQKIGRLGTFCLLQTRNIARDPCRIFQTFAANLAKFSSTIRYWKLYETSVFTLPLENTCFEIIFHILSLLEIGRSTTFGHGDINNHVPFRPHHILILSALRFFIPTNFTTQYTTLLSSFDQFPSKS